MNAFRFFVLMTVVLACGCASPTVGPQPGAEVMSSALLSFIEDGTTTREEVLLTLGSPSSTYEHEEILCYQLRAHGREDVSVYRPRRDEDHPGFMMWRPDLYSLVLAFDPNGVLVKHSLVGTE